MSYLDPQRFGDVDAGGNALDWTSRKNKLLYPGHEMLRKAIVERCNADKDRVDSVGVPGILEIARAPGRIYTGDYLTTFHDTISALIPRFVNHENNNGSWHGSSRYSIAPEWTEASILLAIGDDARVPIDNVFSAEWSLQQYKILNMLRWIQVETPTTILNDDSPSTPPHEGQKWFFDGQTKTGDASTGIGETWADCVADYLAAPWSSTGQPPMNYTRNQAWSKKDNTLSSDSYIITRSRAKVKLMDFTSSHLLTYSMGTSIDWYAYMRDPATPNPAFTMIFDDEGLGFSKASHWLYETGTEYITGEDLASGYPTDRESPYVEPPNPPALPPAHTVAVTWSPPTVPSINTDYIHAVVKFDVPGGFQFMDK